MADRQDSCVVAGSGCGIPAAGRTHTGMVRKLNEDYICMDKKSSLFIVADGMGGHGGGDTASRETALAMQAYFATHNLDVVFGDMAVMDQPDDMAKTVVGAAPAVAVPDCSARQIISLAVSYANERVMAINRMQMEKGVAAMPMGTTIAGIWISLRKDSVAVFHVGDSRVYRFRSGSLVRLTLDHSLYEDWKREGMKGLPPDRNVLTMAVGAGRFVEPSISLHPLLPGDLFLICSDGLTGMVDDEAIAAALAPNSSENLQEICDKLVGTANGNGGTDNISVVLAALPLP